MVQVDSELYLPQWVLDKQARERVAVLMKRQNPESSYRHTVEQLAAMRPNQKVQGVVTVEPSPSDKDQNFLIVPSLGMLSKEEVTDIVGRIKEGGYGKGPEHRSKDVNWKRAWPNVVDYMAERRQAKAKGRTITW